MLTIIVCFLYSQWFLNFWVNVCKIICYEMFKTQHTNLSNYVFPKVIGQKIYWFLNKWIKMLFFAGSIYTFSWKRKSRQRKSRISMFDNIMIIYDEAYFREEQVDELYNIMSQLGVYDYRLKVRINVPHFWEKIINELLSE